MKLPNGKLTANKTAYLDAWAKIGDTVGEFLDAKPYGFDPDYSFIDKNGKVFHLPLTICLRIVEKIK